MKKLNSRTPVVFHVGLVLLCMVLFSTYLTGGLYARYVTTSSGSDSARVAKFDVVNKIQTATQSITLHFYKPEQVSDTIDFQVNSTSEVAVKYDVVVTMPALPNGADYSWLEIKLGEETPVANGTVFTFSNVGTFAPNDTNVHKYELTFTIKKDMQGNPPADLEDISSTVKITVHAEQID